MDHGHAPGELRPRKANAVAWILWIAIAVMAVVGARELYRRARPDPVQEELIRYAQLTVPGYLEDLSRLHALLDKLDASGALQPPQARALLVDQLMPQLIRMKKRAESIDATAPSVKESNQEYLGAVEGYMEMERMAVRAIDDSTALVASEVDGSAPAPGASPDGGVADPVAAHRAIVARRRQSDEAVRSFMAGLRLRCKEAGIRVETGEASR